MVTISLLGYERAKIIAQILSLSSMASSFIDSSADRIKLKNIYNILVNSLGGKEMPRNYNWPNKVSLAQT